MPTSNTETDSAVSLQSHGKQVSLQLHVDGARVTSVSLQGNRLAVKIEAELRPVPLESIPASHAELRQPVHEPPALAPEPANPPESHTPLPLVPSTQKKSETVFSPAGILADISTGTFIDTMLAGDGETPRVAFGSTPGKCPNDDLDQPDFVVPSTPVPRIGRETVSKSNVAAIIDFGPEGAAQQRA